MGQFNLLQIYEDVNMRRRIHEDSKRTGVFILFILNFFFFATMNLCWHTFTVTHLRSCSYGTYAEELQEDIFALHPNIFTNDFGRREQRHGNLSNGLDVSFELNLPRSQSVSFGEESLVE